MSGAIYMAASGALLNQKRLEILSDNLANMNTSGFKETLAYLRVTNSPRAVDADLERLSRRGPDATRPLYQTLETRSVFRQGHLRQTGNPLDLALDGPGFFCVETPAGVRYTRNGNFTRNLDGELTTHDGYRVLGNGGAIEIGEGGVITVDAEGGITVGDRYAGQLRMVDFERPERLERSGQTLFAPGDQVQSDVEHIAVTQGYLEMSNVEAVRTMTEMIEVLRGYESYQKTIRQLDETTAKVINDVGRTS